MRPARRLQLNPAEYRDHAAAERRRTLRELLDLLARSRAEPWYRWIRDGRPVLSEPEYRAVKARGTRGDRRAA